MEGREGLGNANGVEAVRNYNLYFVHITDVVLNLEVGTLLHFFLWLVVNC